MNVEYFAIYDSESFKIVAKFTRNFLINKHSPAHLSFIARLSAGTPNTVNIFAIYICIYMTYVCAKHSSYQNMRRDFEMTPNIINKLAKFY